MNRSEFTPEPCVLASDRVTLRPLLISDAMEFYTAGKYEELWRWVQPNQCSSLAQSQSWIEQSLARQAEGQHVPFVVLDNASERVIGSTRFCSIRPEDRNIEIGFTFISPEFQRTHVNTHCKYLLLAQAFDVWGAVRVEFKTHEKNLKSRNAIARLGAQFEGVLRNQRILPDGSLRNTALFSVTEQEWPGVKRALEVKMKR